MGILRHMLNLVKVSGDIDMDAVDLPVGFGTSSITDHDMRRYIATMYSRLSNDARQTANNPVYLVRGDVGANGYPII